MPAGFLEFGCQRTQCHSLCEKLCQVSKSAGNDQERVERTWAENSECASLAAYVLPELSGPIKTVSGRIVNLPLEIGPKLATSTPRAKSRTFAELLPLAIREPTRMATIYHFVATHASHAPPRKARDGLQGRPTSMRPTGHSSFKSPRSGAPVGIASNRMGHREPVSGALDAGSPFHLNLAQGRVPARRHSPCPPARTTRFRCQSRGAP